MGRHIIVLLAGACIALSLTACAVCSADGVKAAPIKYVWTDMHMYTPSDPVKITAWVAETTPVSRVTADGVDLNRLSGILWEGTISAKPEMGEHSVLVQAYYDGSVAEDTTCVYKTVRAVALSTAALLTTTAAAVKDSYLFAVCGQVAVKDSVTFFVSDGSSAPLEVHCNNHGLATGDFARARGEWHPSASPFLTSRALDVRNY